MESELDGMNDDEMAEEFALISRALQFCPPEHYTFEEKEASSRPLGKWRKPTLSAERPWAAMGMSRATWYRRKKEMEDGK